jgi:hypothetical protein
MQPATNEPTNTTSWRIHHIRARLNRVRNASPPWRLDALLFRRGRPESVCGTRHQVQLEVSSDFERLLSYLRI